MINELINSYLKYLTTQFKTEKLEKNTYKVITPFLDKRNDNIVFYIIMKNNIITLTDDGYTLEDLEFSGLKLTEKRMNEIYKILNSYNVCLENKKLFVNATLENFVQKQHNFIQALLSINKIIFF